MIPFQIVDTAASFPFMTVGHSTDGPIVDTHFFFDLGGDEYLHIYFNEREAYNILMSKVLQRPDYVASLAEVYGFLTAEKADALTAERDEAIAERDAAQLELAEWRPVIARFEKKAEKYEREAA